MRINPVQLTALTAALILVAGCGSDSPDELAPTTEPTPEPAADPAPEPTNDAPAEPETDDAAEEPVAAEVLGVVNVDGVAYDITELRNCEPYEVDMIDVELELQGLGEHNGERVQIDVYIQTIAGTPFDDVSWAGPEGIFGGPEDAEVTLLDGGASVSGAATLVDAMTQTDSVSIDFDMEVPADTIACR